MKKFKLSFLCSLICFFATAQIEFSGKVIDAESNEPLEGIVVSLNDKMGTVTNRDGLFSFKLQTGKYILKCFNLAYQNYLNEIEIGNQNLFLEIKLIPQQKELNVVTISGSRFAKKVQEEVVSIEVVKPNKVLNSGLNSMDDALNRVPGVDVIDNQINIRGGAGWSYGAGSRVQILVDDMPMLTADAGDVKWNFLPIENCSQIEIIKGASSTLYGSGALNGTVNFRTAYAKNKPITKFMLYKSYYGNPKNKDWKWWDKQPGFGGGYFSHAQKIKNLDLIVGAAFYSETSYLQGDEETRGRVNFNVRYQNKKIDGLSYGLNGNAQFGKTQSFFFWAVDTLAEHSNAFLQPYGGLADSTTTLNKNDGQRINIDPYIQFIGKKNTKHILRARWFRSLNDIPEKLQSSTADLFYSEYQIQKNFNSNNTFLNALTLTGGMLSNLQNVTGDLYGNHKGKNMAIYTQADKRIKKLWLNAGIRLEANQIDAEAFETKPVFRFGSNYELTKATFLRASFGQGYRYPSIAERFVKTNFGPSSVFPHPDLKSETGWSAELAVKQLWKKNNWFGYFDIAGFWMEYNDMMEFNFGIWLPKDSTLQQVHNALSYLGFRSNNVGRSRINGIDFSTFGQGKINDFALIYLIAYTHMNPVQINPDSAIIANLSGDTYTLKYRYNHSVKTDVQVNYKKYSIGGTALYNSFMKNIDEVFENNSNDKNIYGTFFNLGTKGLPSAIRKFRNENNNGFFRLDIRTQFAINKIWSVGFIIQNVFNTVYTERPALIAPLRNFNLQLKAEF